jgi:alanyl aminopeptidase
MFLRAMVAVALLFAGLGSAAPEMPPFGLTDDAVPRRYSLELTIDPDRDSYAGTVRIDVDLIRPASTIWLNATGLTISEATAQTAARTWPLRTNLIDDDFLELDLGSRVAAGRVELTLKYQAPLADKAVIGPYRLKYEDRWYVFTTFTPQGARRAFPCFDQPRFKTPWDVSIHVRKDRSAFANAASVRETNEEGNMKLVEFATTEPLPSEMVAFAAGPLDVYAGQPCGQAHLPIRVITTHGHASEGEEAACATPGILAKLEAYTGIPYAFDKLDHVAIPELPFGAVENAGLITYRAKGLLFIAGKTPDKQKQSIRAVEAHEMAHQWFGDLVTQAGWEDVWLSEGFATWLSSKVMDDDEPAPRRRLGAVAAREKIMLVDASAKTRPVRESMHGREAMKDVYSRFVYNKGAAVLMMLEGWLGENVVRSGVRKYLIDHRFGNATTGDLAAELRIVSDIDPSEVMHDFLDQAGVPRVRFDVRCEPGTAPRILLEQTNTVSQWDVPVCWRSDAASDCTIVNGRRQVEMPRGVGCPVWVYPNGNGSGYFRTDWSAAQVAALPIGRLTAPERLTLVDDLNFARSAGLLDAAAVQVVLMKLAGDRELEIAEAAAKAMEEK